MMVRIRGNSFQADVMIAGDRYRKHFKTREEAEDYERLAGRGKVLPKRPSFRSFHRAHFEYLWGDCKAPSSAQLCLDALDRYINLRTLLTEIDRLYIFDLISRMKRDGVSNGTINRRLSTLSKLLRHAERLEIMRRPHIEFLKEPHGRERTLSDLEELKIDRYLRHTGLDWAWAVTFFLLYTGCRLGEAYSLERYKVEGNRVTFGYATTKTATTRVVPLVGPAQDAWAFMCRASDAARPLANYPREAFRNHWKLLRTHLNCQHDREFVPHMLRHTCASRLVSRGVPLPKVMLWMGHTSIQTTLRYAHLVPSDLDEAAVALERSVPRRPVNIDGLRSISDP